MTADAGPASVRQLAVSMIDRARNPPEVPVGGGFTTTDQRSADRDARLALAASLVYLADVMGDQSP